MHVSQERKACLVTWHVREDMMNDVVLNDAMEDVATNEAKLAINGGESALCISPSVGIIMSRFRMSVVKICNCNYAMVSFMVSELLDNA
jgi:hypothetical protein